MALPKNVGSVDKIVRIVIGALLAAYALMVAGLSSTIGIITLIAGAILIVTGLVNFCPIFKVLGISSISAAKRSDVD